MMEPMLTNVEAQILRNQLASMMIQIRMLTGMIDAKSNRDRDYLRVQIYATAEMLNLPREEVL